MRTLNDFMPSLLGASIVAVDTEASGNDIRDGRGWGCGISIATGSDAIFLPYRYRLGENLDLSADREVLNAVLNTKTLIFHNAKFDLVSLETMGINFQGKFYDTMLMAHLINENWLSKGLDWLGKELLGESKRDQNIVRGLAKSLGGWDMVDPQIMGPYAIQDAELTLKLYKFLRPMFDKQELDLHWTTRDEPFVRLLAKMESRGVRVDVGLAQRQAEHGRQRMELVAQSLSCNPGSPKDLEFLLLGELNLPIYKRTPGGKPCFDKFAMEMYEADLDRLGSPVAKQLKEYRGWSKACAVAYEGYPGLLSPDGRLRPNYKMHGTVTGRLSCEKPNLQQIPRVSEKPWDGALKSLFIPADGYELWEADYSQLELRLGAAYAGERSLLEEFANPDGDVFTRMAAELGFSRNDTKTLTYTLQYGGGIKRLCDVFGVDPGRAEQIRDTYFQRYPGFKRVTKMAESKAKSRGYVKLWSGRRRHFVDPEAESFKAFNSVIQGGSADIVKDAMLRLYRTVDGPDCRMLLQVHDSVVFEIRSDMVDTYTPQIKKVMEAVEPDFGVQFAVQVKKWGGD